MMKDSKEIARAQSEKWFSQIMADVTVGIGAGISPDAVLAALNILRERLDKFTIDFPREGA